MMANEMRPIDANVLSEKIGNMKAEITHKRGGYRYCNEAEKNEWDKLDSFDRLVCDTPTVDAVPVVHGRWITEYWKSGYIKRCYCSECGEPPKDAYKPDNYCPNCGAQMEADGNEP